MLQLVAVTEELNGFMKCLWTLRKGSSDGEVIEDWLGVFPSRCGVRTPYSIRTYLP